MEVIKVESLARNQAALDATSDMLATLALREDGDAIARFGDQVPALWDGRRLVFGEEVLEVLRDG